MIALLLATERALLLARQGSRWTVEEHLRNKAPQCLAVDPHHPGRLYCGTAEEGLWRSDDAGRSWEPVGPGIVHSDITAVAVSRTERGVVYAGTEPSAIFRSDNGGETWVDLAGLRVLPSASSWSFPPRPETHHVRWIEADHLAAGRVYVAIEAGALVRTPDGGRSWQDRVRGGPIDTHTAATHKLAPGRIYSAAGDGYFESDNAGESWSHPVQGLRHHYLVGVAVDPVDPDTVVSAATGPWVAYTPPRAEAFVYRKTKGGSFQEAMDGLPKPQGSTASRFATPLGESEAIYAANNHGVFQTVDAGRTWKALEIPWPQQAFGDGVYAAVGFIQA